MVLGTSVPLLVSKLWLLNLVNNNLWSCPTGSHHRNCLFFDSNIWKTSCSTFWIEYFMKIVTPCIFISQITAHIDNCSLKGYKFITLLSIMVVEFGFEALFRQSTVETITVELIRTSWRKTIFFKTHSHFEFSPFSWSDFTNLSCGHCFNLSLSVEFSKFFKSFLGISKENFH